jgi:medium-chain acyl-[acyl-carrier-protein] hydrolase
MSRDMSRKWIKIVKPQPLAGVRLFCLPYAGAGTAVFRAWQDCIGPDIEVCMVQLPGREERIDEEAASHIDDLIPSLTSGLVPYLTKPFAIFGHSMGGLIAFSLTHYLSRYGYCPVRTFLSAASGLTREAAQNPRGRWCDADIVQELHRLNGIRQDVFFNTELLELVLPAIRADFNLVDSFRLSPDAYIDAPISAFAGQHDAEVRPDEVMAWSAHTSASFDLHILPGDHFFINSLTSEVVGLIQRLVNPAEAKAFAVPDGQLYDAE